MKPSVTHDHILLPWADIRMASSPCGAAGCVWAGRPCGENWGFVHDGLGRYAMLEITWRELADFDLDIWGLIALPWIERLHREAEA